MTFSPPQRDQPTKPPNTRYIQQTIGHKEDSRHPFPHPLPSVTVCEDGICAERTKKKIARANAMQLSLTLSKLGCNVTYLHIFWQDMLYLNFHTLKENGTHMCVWASLWWWGCGLYFYVVQLGTAKLFCCMFFMHIYVYICISNNNIFLEAFFSRFTVTSTCRSLVVVWLLW